MDNRWLAVQIAALLLIGGFLGYLISPASSKLEAHDRKGDRMLAVSQVACGYLAQLNKEPTVRCYDPVPLGFVGTGSR
mgnify:CR=1 FL=1